MRRLWQNFLFTQQIFIRKKLERFPRLEMEKVENSKKDNISCRNSRKTKLETNPRSRSRGKS